MRNQQPLRQRCSVQLTVRTTLSSKPRKGPGSFAWSIACRMPHFLKPTRPAVRQVNNAPIMDMSTSWTSPPIRLEALTPIFSDLSVAYCDFDYAASASPQYAHPLSNKEASHLRSYTHIIRVVHAKDPLSIGKWKADFNEKYGIHSLTLLVPPAPLQLPPRRMSTFLNPKQLEVACDAMFLALPHDSIANPRKREVEGSGGDPANVLVTVPRGDSGEVDAMSVVLTYLSFVARGHACMVWEDIRRDDSVRVEWRRAFESGGAKNLCWLQRNLDLWAKKEAEEKREEEEREREREEEKNRRKKKAPSNIPMGRLRAPCVPCEAPSPCTNILFLVNLGACRSFVDGLVLPLGFDVL